MTSMLLQVAESRPMNEIEIKKSLRSFIEGFVRRGSSFDDEQDIFQGGFVNSLFAMQLVLHVESNFGVQVESADMDLSNFKSISAITRFVRTKLAATARA